MEYTLKIKSIEYNQEEVILLIHWEYTISENDNSYSIGGTVILDDVNENFIPLEDIEVATLKEWVLSKINLEEKHDDLIQELNNQTQVNKLILKKIDE